MKISHINVVSRDADALAIFYRKVFGFEVFRGPVFLSGEKVSRGNGLPNSAIQSLWLKLPGIAAPFLEIHEHGELHVRGAARVNATGFGHIAFEVPNIAETLSAVLAAGGSQMGEITDFESEDAPLLIVYARDP